MAAAAAGQGDHARNRVHIPAFSPDYIQGLKLPAALRTCSTAALRTSDIVQKEGASECQEIRAVPNGVGRVD